MILYGGVFFFFFLVGNIIFALIFFGFRLAARRSIIQYSRIIQVFDKSVSSSGVKNNSKKGGIDEKMTSEPKIHSVSELSAQKEVVKAGLTRRLEERQIWAPVASGWFNQWKKYVDFDEEHVEKRSDDELRS